MSETTSTFATRLKALRERAGLSQYALAKRTGLSKQALSRLELGERGAGVTWETVQLLSLAFGVDYSEFIDPNLHLPEETPAKPFDAAQDEGGPNQPAGDPAKAKKKPARASGRKRKET